MKQPRNQPKLKTVTDVFNTMSNKDLLEAINYSPYSFKLFCLGVAINVQIENQNIIKNNINSIN